MSKSLERERTLTKNIDLSCSVSCLAFTCSSLVKMYSPRDTKTG